MVISQPKSWLFFVGDKMSCVGCRDFEQKEVFCDYCKVVHLEGICKRSGCSFLAPNEGVRCEHYEKLCRGHVWEEIPEDKGFHISGGSTTLFKNVSCLHCRVKGKEIWAWVNTEAVKDGE